MSIENKTKNEKRNNQSINNVEAFSTMAKIKIDKWSHTCFVPQHC